MHWLDLFVVWGSFFLSGLIGGVVAAFIVLRVMGRTLHEWLCEEFGGKDCDCDD